MALSNNVRDVLALIEDMRLPHPGEPLLASFIKDAVDPDLAANYVWGKVLERNEQSLVPDWTYIVQSLVNGATPPAPDMSDQRKIAQRDGNRCCVTGKPGGWWDPLIVAPVLHVPAGWLTDKPRIHEMLGAFFGNSYRDWLLSQAKDSGYTSSYSNHWLVRKSAYEALSRGLVCLERQEPSMIEYRVEEPLLGPENSLEVDGPYPVLADHTRSGTEKVSPYFVGSHARLCRSIRFVEIAKSLASESSCPAVSKPTATCRSAFSPISCASTIFLNTWLLFPSRFRLAIYQLLAKLGTFLYGKPNHHAVQRLPFGLYLKRNTEPAESRNEFNALRLLHRHTSIPVPKPLDIIHIPAKDPRNNDPFYSDHYPQSYLLSTRIPGIPIYRCQHVLSDADLQTISLYLTDYFSQLRSIPAPPNPQGADLNPMISDTLGGPCRDPRIRASDPVGPFPDEQSFNQVLRFPDDPARKGHKIVFTHADLNPRNILVSKKEKEGWRVEGIVDWENAGFYPDYWDCTKALFEGFRWTKRYNDMVRGVFDGLREGGYKREREVEERAWGEGDGV